MSVSLSATYQKETALLGMISISNETFENGSRTYAVTPFEYQIVDIDGNVVKNFHLTSESQSNISFQLPIGTYSIVQSIMQGYTLESMNINGNTLTSSPFAFTIDEDDDVQIVAKNIANTSGEVAALPSNNVDTGVFQQSNVLYIILGISSALLACILYVKKKKLIRKDV